MGKLNDLLTSIISKVNASVKTEAQTLTDEQKTQARQNIGAAAEGEGGVQTDWNQTDETAADFIKNKPFHKESTVIEIMPDQEVTGVLENSIYIANVTSFVNDMPGSLLRFIVDGVVYDKKKTSMGDGWFYYGNPGMVGVGADDGTPFACVFDTITPALMVGFLDSESHTVSISNRVEQDIISYLPIHEVVFIQNETGWVANMSFADIADIVSSGQQVRGKAEVFLEGMSVNAYYSLTSFIPGIQISFGALTAGKNYITAETFNIDPTNQVLHNNTTIMKETT